MLRLGHITISDPFVAKGTKYSDWPVLGTSLRKGSYSPIQATWNGFPHRKKGSFSRRSGEVDSGQTTP